MKNTVKIIAAASVCLALGIAGTYFFMSRNNDKKDKDFAIQFQTNDQGIIEWKYENEDDSQWRPLIAKTDLESGSTAEETEFRNQNGVVQYKDKDGNWIDVAIVKTLEG